MRCCFLYGIDAPATQTRATRIGRVLPLTVASTVGLFGTGVALVVLDPGRGLIVGLHKASFVVWFGQ